MATPNPTLEFLTMTRIGEKGQLTVPTQFRKDLGLEAGAPFVVLRLGNRLMLLPEQERFQELCQRVSSKLTAAGLKPEEILVTLGKTRGRVYARRYGKGLSARRGVLAFIVGSENPAEVSTRRRIRLFLDSNVLTGGIVSPWASTRLCFRFALRSQGWCSQR